MKKPTNKQIACLAMLIALSMILLAIPFLRFSIFPAVPFLEYDAADIPIMIATFMFGPSAGLVATVIVAGFQALTVSQASGWLGFVMHVAATGIYVIISGLIYKHHRNLKGALVALLCGIVGWVAVMIPINLLLTPLYFNAPRSMVVSLLKWIVLFNLIKAGVNSVMTFLLYKRIKYVLVKITDAPKAKSKSHATQENQTDVVQKSSNTEDTPPKTITNGDLPLPAETQQSNNENATNKDVTQANKKQ